MQGKIFDSLMEKVKVKADSKIIDIGCGTGNNTFKLSKMIEDEWIVTGIDPIKQRIEKASDVYGFKSNLNFKEGSAEDSWQFGTDHDLAVSTTVLHWVPVNKRKEAFRGIYKSLKPNSMFVFDAVRSHNFNSAFVVENVSCYNQFLENAFPLSKEDAENVFGWSRIPRHKRDRSWYMHSFSKLGCLSTLACLLYTCWRIYANFGWSSRYLSK